MKNCNVKKLLGSVNNENLLKLGEMRITTHSAPNTGLSGYLRAYVVFNKPGEISIIKGSGVFDNNQAKTKTYTAGAACEFTTTASGDVISIDNKYAITTLELRYSKNAQNVEFSIDDLLYSLALQSLDATQNHGLDYHVKGNLVSLADKTSLALLKLSNSEVQGDISNLSALTNLVTLDVGNSPVSGNIVSLGTLIGLTSLACAGSNVGGAFESLCESMVANGRTSGSFNGYFGYANITLLGSPITDSRLYVTFNSATSISIGTTVGGNDVATGTYSGGSWSWV